MSPTKESAYETLYECLMIVCQLMAPISPFFSDWLYKNLTDNIRESAIKHNTPLKHDSVHLSFITHSETSRTDKELEERMALAQTACSLILSLRKKEKIKVRQPLQKVRIPVLNEEMKTRFEKVANYIMGEVNVKQIEYLSEDSGIIKKKIKPNFKELGKKAGAKMKAIQSEILNFSAAQIHSIETQQRILLNVHGEDFELLLTDVEILSEDIPGMLVASQGNVTVALDITISEALRKEGVAREFINKIQNLRKDKNFNVIDRIKVSLVKNPLVEEALIDFREYIQTETLADDILFVENLISFDEVELNEETLQVRLEVL